MDKYFTVPDGISSRRNFVYGMGLIDLTVTVLLLFNHFLQPSTPAISGIAMALNLSTHFYAWAGTWVLGSTMVSANIAFFCFAVYGVAFIIDIAAALLRAYFGPGGLFGWFTFAIGVIYISIDIFQGLECFGLSWRTKKFRMRMIKAVNSVMDSNVRANKLHKVKRFTYYFRTLVSTTWKFQLFFVAVTLFQFFLGLSFSISFGLIMLLELPHAFIWLWAWSVAGTPQLYPFDAITDQSYLIQYIYVFAMTLALSVTASVARLVLLLVELITPTIAPPLWRSIVIAFGWFALVIGIALAVIAAIEVYSTYKINKSMTKYTERTQEWFQYIANQVEMEMKKIEEEEEEEEEEDE